MRRVLVAALGLITLLGAQLATTAEAQPVDAATTFVRVANGYRLVPNVTYLRAGGVELTLDVYQPRGASAPTPTLMYIHGGGWTNGSKEASALTFLPYLEMGWAVVNVEYRMADDAHAPAAVEDCRCALRWIYRNAGTYNFDVDAIVVTGNSAGGHLALTSGFLTASAGLDRQCPGDRRRTWTTGETSTEALGVAAVINWYGITDVADLVEGPNTKGYAVQWLGGLLNRAEVARLVSPLTFVSADVPPVLTIHGDADPIVPYQQAVRLHAALEAEGVDNKLHTVPGGGHGGFNTEETLAIYEVIFDFLAEHKLAGDMAMSGQD